MTGAGTGRGAGTVTTGAGIGRGAGADTTGAGGGADCTTDATGAWVGPLQVAQLSCLCAERQPSATAGVSSAAPHHLIHEVMFACSSLGQSAGGGGVCGMSGPDGPRVLYRTGGETDSQIVR